MLVGVDFNIFRMVDRNEAELIDVVNLFHWLHKSQAEATVYGGEVGAVDLHPFSGVGGVSARGGKPVAHDASADDVDDKLVVIAIPDEEHRT